MEGRGVVTIVLDCDLCGETKDECFCEVYTSPSTPQGQCEECGMIYGCTCDYEDLSEVEEDSEDEEDLFHIDEETRAFSFYNAHPQSTRMPLYVQKNVLCLRGVPCKRNEFLVDATDLDDRLEVNFLLALTGGGEGDELYVTKCGKVKYDTSREWVMVSSLKAKNEGKYPNHSATKNQPKLKEEVFGDSVLVQFDGSHFYSFPPIYDLEAYKRQFFTSKPN